jgi:hypothetical protein
MTHTYAAAPESSSPILCGNDTVYCPAGVGQPLVAGQGYYTDGASSLTRSARLPCPAGSYCPGDGRAHDCPVGTFGDSPGLSNASCSGRCVNGVFCDTRSTSALGIPCPPGSYCVQGVPVACPAGTFLTATGAASAAACTPCPSNTYGTALGAMAPDACVACPDFEGSDPGATACWPGIIGIGCVRGVRAC